MKAEEQRFNSEFLPLFDSDLNLGDIPNLLKVRDSFEESTLTKYLMDLDKPKRKDIFNKVFKLLINEYLDHKGIKPKKITGYPGRIDSMTAVIAKLKSNEGKVRYLTIGDNDMMFKDQYGSPDYEICIVGYEEHPMVGKEFQSYVEYGTWNFIDYHFFNCLNLEKGVVWENTESKGNYNYEFDSLSFDVEKDQGFEKSGMQDFYGNDLYDNDTIVIQFNDTKEYKTIFNYSKDRDMCLVKRPEQGLSCDISKQNIISNVKELKKVK